MSFTFANLPGVQVTTVDGGLAAVNTPTDQLVCVFGTSAIGPANSPYQVVSIATAASLFGLNGTLTRGMSETSAYCDNVTLFRIGTSQGTFTVGATGAGSQSIGTIEYAYSNAAGTLYTYVCSTTLSDDVFPGALVTTTGFTPSAFNITSQAVTTINQATNTFTVTINPAVPVGTPEQFVFKTANGHGVIADNIATITFDQVSNQVINVGDSLTIAGATSSVLDGTGLIVLSSVLTAGVWTVTYTSTTMTLAGIAQTAGTITNTSVYQTNDYILSQAIINTMESVNVTDVAASVDGIAAYTNSTPLSLTTNEYQGFVFVVTGFVGANNNGTFICTSNSVTTIYLSNGAATAETGATATLDSSASNTGYLGTITGGDNNGIVGDSLVISGFTTSGNDGPFTVTASGATAFGVVNSSGANESHTAIAYTTTVEGTGTVAVSANPGYTVILGEVAATANTDYSVWYSDGILTLWLNNNLVYSNDPNINVNTGDSIVSGAAVGGTAVNNGVPGNPDTLGNALTIQQAISLSPVSPDIAPTYMAPGTGIGLTARQIYIAQQNAMNLLQGYPIDMAVVPTVIADNPNVAFYVSATPSTAINNPVTNPNALDWLWTGVDYYGNPVYQWATESVFWDSNNLSHSAWPLQGATSPSDTTTATPISPNFTSAETRLTSGVGPSFDIQPEGFHEVNFAYQLARFCAAQSEAPQNENGGCFGFIGTSGPASLSNFSLPAVKTWIGFLPTYGVNGAGVTYPTISGAGLLGIPFLVGCTSATLNQACADFANGYRQPGLFTSDSGEYDGGPMIDANGYPVQCGAYIAVQGDYGLMSNGYGTYVGNIAQLIAGEVSSLDQLNAITNKQVAGVQQLYRASLNQLDSLTFADINMLRFKGVGQLPVALHDKTAATTLSDYTLTLRQRIKFLMIETLLAEANNYIGNGTNDGLSLTALETALDTDALNLQKRGYISSYNFTITSTLAQQKIGQASIQISFVPADELVQLNATIGINLNG